MSLFEKDSFSGVAGTDMLFGVWLVNRWHYTFCLEDETAGLVGSRLLGRTGCVRRVGGSTG